MEELERLRAERALLRFQYERHAEHLRRVFEAESTERVERARRTQQADYLHWKRDVLRDLRRARNEVAEKEERCQSLAAHVAALEAEADAARHDRNALLAETQHATRLSDQTAELFAQVQAAQLQARQAERRAERKDAERAQIAADRHRLRVALADTGKEIQVMKAQILVLSQQMDLRTDATGAHDMAAGLDRSVWDHNDSGTPIRDLLDAARRGSGHPTPRHPEPRQTMERGAQTEVETRAPEPHRRPSVGFLPRRPSAVDSGLEAELEELRLLVPELRVRIGELEADSAEAQERHNKALTAEQRETAAVQHRVLELEKEVASARATVANDTASIAALRDAHDRLHSQLVALTQEHEETLRAQAEANNAHQSQAAEAEAALTAAIERASAAEKALAQQVSSHAVLHQMITELEARVDEDPVREITEKEQELNQRIAELEVQVLNATNASEEQGIKWTEMQNALHTAQAEVERLRTTLEAMRSQSEEENDLLQAKLQAAAENAKAAESQIRVLETKIDMLKTEGKCQNEGALRVSEAEASDMSVRVAIIEAENASLKRKLEDQTEVTILLQSKLQAAELAADEKAANMGTIEAERATLVAQLEDGTKANALLEVKLQTLNAELKASQGQMLTIQAEIERFEARDAEQTKAALQAHEELVGARAEAEGLQAQLRESAAESVRKIQVLKDQLRQSVGERTTAEQQVDEARRALRELEAKQSTAEAGAARKSEAGGDPPGLSGSDDARADEDRMFLEGLVAEQTSAHRRTLETFATTLEAHAATQDALTQQRERTAAAESAVREARQEHAKLLSDAEVAAVVEAAAHREALDAVKGVEEELRRRLTESHTEVQDLQLRLATATADAIAVQSEVATNRAARTDLEEQLAAAHEDYRAHRVRAEEAAAEAQSRVEVLQQQVTTLRGALEETERQSTATAAATALGVAQWDAFERQYREWEETSFVTLQGAVEKTRALVAEAFRQPFAATLSPSPSPPPAMADAAPEAALEHLEAQVAQLTLQRAESLAQSLVDLEAHHAALTCLEERCQKVTLRPPAVADGPKRPPSPRDGGEAPEPHERDLQYLEAEVAKLTHGKAASLEGMATDLGMWLEKLQAVESAGRSPIPIKPLKPEREKVHAGLRSTEGETIGRDEDVRPQQQRHGPGSTVGSDPDLVERLQRENSELRQRVFDKEREIALFGDGDPALRLDLTRKQERIAQLKLTIADLNRQINADRSRPTPALPS
jgi:chromosome segregation ATPase